jgi:hypothetical protein
LVPHPCNDGSFRSVLNWDAFGPSYGSASNGRGVIGHNTSQSLSQGGMGGIKGKELHDSPGEILSINCLDFISSLCIGLFAFGEALGGSLGFEFGLYPVNRGCRRPHAPFEQFATLLFLDYPVIASSFHSSG